MLPTIESQSQLERLIDKYGVLPFFDSPISGFSIWEHTPAELQFSDEVDGPWEWKGPICRNQQSAYGKFFSDKAGFVSLDIFRYFAAYRRSKYTLNAEETRILNTIIDHESMLTSEIRKTCGYKRNYGKKKPSSFDILTKETKPAPKAQSNKSESFDKIMTRLQMGAYVVIADFEYKYKHDGTRYGWGLARYSTPELLFENLMDDIDSITPDDARLQLINHLKTRLPFASAAQIEKLIG
ncbi:MAG: hypothetical protein J6Y72_07550 [Bacteroidales bacterium]|nr:hypothetical protein [Bacteroidales bacterium]